MHTKIFDLGTQSVKIETGLIAKQANASATVDIDGTVILATIVASSEPNDRDFFPLTVNYNEKTYAAGKIPAVSSNVRVDHRKGNFDKSFDRQTS